MATRGTAAAAPLPRTPPPLPKAILTPLPLPMAIPLTTPPPLPLTTPPPLIVPPPLPLTTPPPRPLTTPPPRPLTTPPPLPLTAPPPLHLTAPPPLPRPRGTAPAPELGPASPWPRPLSAKLRLLLSSAVRAFCRSCRALSCAPVRAFTAWGGGGGGGAFTNMWNHTFCVLLYSGKCFVRTFAIMFVKFCSLTMFPCARLHLQNIWSAWYAHVSVHSTKHVIACPKHETCHCLSKARSMSLPVCAFADTRSSLQGQQESADVLSTLAEETSPVPKRLARRQRDRPGARAAKEQILCKGLCLLDSLAREREVVEGWQH